MNTAGAALAWCAVQVALVGAATVGVYWLVVKLHQAAGGFAATTSLAVVFCLSAAAASPWPRWNLLNDRPAENDEENAARSRWAKVPILGALTKALGRTAAPRSNATGPAGAVGATGTVVVSAPNEERPKLARAWLPGGRGASWLDRKPNTLRWRWTASLAVMFAVGFLCGAVRLLLAAAAARSFRHKSVAVNDARLREELAALQAQLGSSRQIEIREIAWLSAPATLGWRRPIILLPAAWRVWTSDERRAVLAHELAHIQRGDYLLWLAARLALVMHFYHPAVHWLAARIRLEQEFAADTMAASLMGGRGVYLTALARLMLRPPHPATAAAPLSFFSTRGMLMQRIERLRRLDSHPAAAGRWASKFVALAILMLAGVIASGLRGQSAPAQGPLPSIAPPVADLAASP